MLGWFNETQHSQLAQCLRCSLLPLRRAHPRLSFIVVGASQSSEIAEWRARAVSVPPLYETRLSRRNMAWPSTDIQLRRFDKNVVRSGWSRFQNRSGQVSALT